MERSSRTGRRMAIQVRMGRSRYLRARSIAIVRYPVLVILLVFIRKVFAFVHCIILSVA
jgi:hypothetical protein